MDHGLDFITSTPPLEYDAASPSPSLYLRVGEGPGGEGGLLMATARLGGADCQASGLPAPKCRELAMGETYADLGESHLLSLGLFREKQLTKDESSVSELIEI